ncbi:MAG TPA: zf-HC2 domain-containing protein [Candidatus Eisenbacteria bacterium]|nr:zf-HC2 domain-containing protein [Candidatus Eisenbacteria bacterium]
MCDFRGPLIAWMDGELAETEAAAVERHVQGCTECRDRVASYEEAGSRFATYYSQATQATPAANLSSQTMPRWLPWAAVAAAVVLIAMALLPRPAKQSPAVVPAVAVAPPPATEIDSNPARQVQPVARRHIAPRRKPRSTEWALAQPAIQIAIPADAVFPPGAVPEGISYIANLSLASDGSVQGVRLQP